MAPAGQAGCRVTGRCFRADGKPLVGAGVRFAPSRSGIWQGRLIGRAPVEAATDAQGRFTVHLAPSSVVGRYQVVIGEGEYVADVPDQPAVAFEEIATAA